MSTQSQVDQLTAREQWNALVSGEACIAGFRDQVQAIGQDTIKFLHGQLSQNVEGLGVGSSSWSLLLQPNGRVIALVRLVRVSDEQVTIDVESGMGTRVHAALSRFLLRTKCTLTLTEHVPVRRLTTTGAASIEGAVRCSPWLGADLFDLSDPEASDESSIGAVSHDVGAAWMAQFAEPRHEADLHDATLPSESGVIPASVAFGKGCYVGQELVERIDSRGRVLKSLMRVESANSFAVDDELFDGDTSVGKVTSAVEHPLGGTVGVALVKVSADRNHLALHSGAEVQLRALIEETIHE
jgi:tRNA-modifying protein YgfZ